MLVNAVASAFLNLGLLAGFPFLLYFAYQKLRRGRDFREIARRAGLQVGEIRFIGYSVIFALFSVTILIVWSPGEAILRQGSASRQFLGLGFSVPAVVMALLYGVVKTGFPEELLFRGLIAGSLSRWLPDVWANVVQAIIFLIPHLFLLFIMPELWWSLPPLVFVLALFVGWVRIKSGSIIGGWLIHASLNVAMALSVAIRTAS